MKTCPLISRLDTVNGTALEIVESVPGMIRAAAHECSKDKVTCEEGRCRVGYDYDVGEFILESYLEETYQKRLIVAFHFCPTCGKQVDRDKVAEAYGLTVADCGW